VTGDRPDLWAGGPGDGGCGHIDEHGYPDPVLSVRLLVVPACCAVAAAMLAACSPSEPATLEPSASASLLVDPAPSPTDSLLAAPTATAATVGGLAPGFPSALLPVPDDATVLLSSAEPVPDSDLVTISLNLRSDASAKALLAAVGKPLEKAGFTRSDPDEKEPELAVQASFTRHDGKEHVLLGILDSGGTRTLTLSGQVEDVA